MLFKIKQTKLKTEKIKKNIVLTRAYNEEFYTTTYATNANLGNSVEGFAVLRSMMFL